MRISTTYILRQIVTPLAAAIAIGLAVLLADRLVRLLEITLGKKSAFSVVFEMLAYLVPHYLGVALPAAFFLGLLFGFSRLSKNSEIDAFFAGGIGLHQLIVPALLLSLFFTGAAAVLFGYAQPHTRYAYRAIIHAVRNVQIFYLAEEGVFMRAENHTFIVDELLRKSNKFKRVFVYYDRGKKGGEATTAESGVLIEIDGEPRPVLRLKSGSRLTIAGAVDTRANALLPRHSTAAFNLVDTPLGAIENTRFRRRGQSQRELTLPELVRSIERPPTGVSRAEITSELHLRIIKILTVLILPILAVPFAMQGARRQRPYGIAMALIIVIVYYELIEQGAVLVRQGKASPLLVLWPIFAAFVAFSCLRFYRRCFQMRPDGLERVFDAITISIAKLRALKPGLRKTS